jgi:predicted pyridoxine 5'-phosphate oxidase superfamily flavin-nucleotide-binding protein
MQRMVREQRLGFVATVTPDGRPNVSPKGTTRLWDDERLFFADIASPGTVANLRANSARGGQRRRPDPAKGLSVQGNSDRVHQR